MKYKPLLSCLRAFMMISGGILLLDALILIATSNVHAGHFLCAFAGASLMLLGAFIKRLPLWIKTLYCICAACTIILCASLVIYGANDTAGYNEDVLIILGAGIKGDEPGVALRGRLDKALEYCSANKSCVIVVSGGQGPQEDTTEAQAMANYLTKHGIESDRIILEQQATSTRQNLEYSKVLLDAYFDSEYSSVLLTNDYHVPRAVYTANKVGYDNISHLSSYTPLYTAAPNVLRELLALCKTVLTIK